MTALVLLSQWNNISIEIWKPINGLPGYDVSNWGRVRSYWRFIKGAARPSKGSRRPTEIAPEPQRFIQGQIDAYGYRAGMFQRNGSAVREKFHRLVAKHFLSDAVGNHVNHINSVRHDNRLDNLEWVTPKGNYDHAYAAGRHRQNGEDNPSVKLRACDVLAIRRCKTFDERKSAAIKYNITESHVRHIVRRKSWAHLGANIT